MSAPRPERKAVKRGFFITFEGTEGTGKSTQVDMLSRELCRRGRRVVTTREPGGTRLGRELRSLLLGLDFAGLSPGAELFLYMADRAQHMAETVKPALDEDQIVVCDRFADATVAYQGFGRGISRDFIVELNREATFGRSPDLTILLDLEDVAAGLQRAVRRNRKKGTDELEDRIEAEEIDFHMRVREGYMALAAAEPERFRVFPAGRPPEQLHKLIAACVQEVLPPGGDDGPGEV